MDSSFGTPPERRFKRLGAPNTALLIAALVWLVAVAAACGGGGGSPTEPEPQSECGPYPDQNESPWFLPYPAGDSYRVMQGNCGRLSHFPDTPHQYAYDFSMYIGAPVAAARNGVVVATREDEPNNTWDSWGGAGNHVVIQHPDGLVSGYDHLDQWGVLVEVGEVVDQGQLIARAGNSGITTHPHLHFEVSRSGSSIPVVFRNTEAHPNGLVEGEVYTAEGY